MTKAAAIRIAATSTRAANLPAISDTRLDWNVSAARSVPRVNSFPVLLMNVARTSMKPKAIEKITAVVAPPAPTSASRANPPSLCWSSGSAVEITRAVAATVYSVVIMTRTSSPSTWTRRWVELTIVRSIWV